MKPDDQTNIEIKWLRKNTDEIFDGIDDRSDYEEDLLFCLQDLKITFDPLIMIKDLQIGIVIFLKEIFMS